MTGAGQRNNRLALRLTVVVWSFGYLLIALTMALGNREATLPLAILSQLPLLAFGLLAMAALRRVHTLTKHAPDPLRWTVLALAVATITCTISAVDLSFHYAVARTIAPSWLDWATVLTPARVFTVVLLYLWTICLNMALFWAVNVNERARQHEARAAAAEVATDRAQAAALRLQLNPHFLFNTLNAITGLVATRRNAQAQTMIAQLADFLRASLAADPEAEVRLADELATAEAYLSIESTRFGERLTVNIDAPSELMDALVPNFILQPLVENAVKHGVATHGGRTRVVVGAAATGDALVISTSNHSRSGKPPAQAGAPNGGPRSCLGLINVRKRLSMLYGDGARLETAVLDDGYSARISLPLRRA